jgi:biopolymer transport protein ExbB
MSFLFTLLQITSAAEVPVATEDQMSVLGLLMKGGYVMIPILLLSVLSLYLFIERFLFISSVGKIDRSFLDRIKQKLNQGDVKGALDNCASEKTPIAQILSKGLIRLGSPVRDIESALESAAGVQVARMEEKLPYLSLIAAIAPMFGFLGTVIGMLKAFYAISIADNISIGIIAGGIYEKMITSATGLIVGILAFVFYTILNSKVDTSVSNIEAETTDFLDTLYKPSV